MSGTASDHPRPGSVEMADESELNYSLSFYNEDAKCLYICIVTKKVGDSVIADFNYCNKTSFTDVKDAVWSMSLRHVTMVKMEKRPAPGVITQRRKMYE
jgi:hypothetical protein